MIEAQDFGMDYDTLNLFANVLSEKTKIKDVFQIEEVLKGMGCEIIVIQNENTTSNFVEIKGENNFSIAIYEGISEELKRFNLFQGFSHYVSHGLNGKNPCYIKSMTEGKVALEGLIFTLCLLIPDELINKMLLNKITTLDISNFFRLPEEIIKIKLDLLNKYKKECV
jgi:Zn-dependent peptidase ImmA (M78 family)